jgi:uncharacterized protein
MRGEVDRRRFSRYTHAPESRLPSSFTALQEYDMERPVFYFETAGKHNTAATLELAHQRALELNVRCLIVASTGGFTARRALTEVGESGIGLVVVGTNRGEFDPDLIDEIEDRGGHVLFADEWDYTYPDVVANAYRKLCEGLKVVMEIAAIAVDAGTIEAGEEVVVVGGTGPLAFPGGGGADTAVVLNAGPSREHALDYPLPIKQQRRRVCEILCMPR